MPEFKIDSAQDGKVLIFRTQGYLDDVGGKALKEACLKSLEGGANLFVFNLSGTPVINSNGLSSLLDLMVRIIDYNEGQVGITGLSKLTRTALQMTGVLTLCKDFPTEAEAISALNA